VSSDLPGVVLVTPFYDRRQELASWIYWLGGTLRCVQVQSGPRKGEVGERDGGLDSVHC
jgi:hypothetical protein